ncbi:MAG: deoxyribose-phosphate aldolase [Phycisphaerae bacterium]
MMPAAGEMARRIDHTLLAPEATPDAVDTLCDEAHHYGFHAVCVAGTYVARAAARLKSTRRNRGREIDGSPPTVVSVAGFPLGSSATEVKAEEARRALADGATEIDMVVALGALIAGDHAWVRRDIESLARVVHGHVPSGILKVILETAALTREQIILGCRCCAEAEADFVKTSTGFHPAGGATVEHVRLLHRSAAPIKVKAAGGIRTAGQARAMLEAGAARLGTSSSVAIMQELSLTGE